MKPSWGEVRAAGRDNEFVEARIAEKEAAVLQDRKAARVVAGNAVDATDCGELLLMLGLAASAEAEGPA